MWTPLLAALLDSSPGKSAFPYVPLQCQMHQQQAAALVYMSRVFRVGKASVVVEAKAEGGSAKHG